MNQTDDLITLDKAANFLGFRHVNSVKSFIKRGHLEVYSNPDSKKKLVKLKEVLNLATPVKKV